MKNIGKTVRNGIGGLALVLSTACEGPKYEEEFRGGFTDPVSDRTEVVLYGVQKDSTGKHLEIDVYGNIFKINSYGDTLNTRRIKIATFEGATAESLYTRLIPRTLESYRAERR